MRLLKKLSSLKRSSGASSSSPASSGRHVTALRSQSSHRQSSAMPACEERQECRSSHLKNGDATPHCSGLSDARSNDRTRGMHDEPERTSVATPDSTAVSRSSAISSSASSNGCEILAPSPNVEGHGGESELCRRERAGRPPLATDGELGPLNGASTVTLAKGRRLSRCSGAEIPGSVTAERDAVAGERLQVQKFRQDAQRQRNSKPGSRRDCRSPRELRNIHSFADLPDVCIRLCFAFLSVEENLKYQLLSRDVRRAVGLDRVLPTDASASPARPALDEPNYSRDRPSGRPRCQDDASHRNWETPVDTEPPRGRDRSQFGDSPATSGSNAALANLSSGNAAADPVAPWRKAAAGVPVFSSLGSFSTNTSNQRQSHQESGEDRGTGPEVAASFEETGRGATTCVFAFYKRLVVGISWLAAPADVRAAYLSQFVGLADLKLYFCPYANQSSEASPTSWTDLWLLLRNNEKSLERLSLVSLPYEAKLFMKPRRSAHAEPDQPPASVPSQHNTPSMSTQLRRVARGASRQSVSAMGRDLGESSAHTFVDEMFRRETRRAPGTRGSLHPGTLYQGEGGSTQAVSGCFPHRPGTTVYLQALREFSIVGSATSCLVTLDAVQPLLPHSLESFSLHGNLPRTLPGPLFGTEEGDRIRSSRAGPGGTGALASRAFQGFGLPGSVRRFFGWEGSENVDLDESDEGKEDEAQVVLSSLEGVGDDATWQLEVSREVLLRSVMMMHNLTVLDIRLPPALDRFSFRLVPSLVLMCTRLRQVTLDFRQLAELVDVSVLTASVVTEPFGVTPLSPSYRLRSDPEAAEARGSSGAGETPAWGGVQTLLPNLTEVVLREPLHVGWAVEDVARLMGVLLALPQCRIIASALVLHQHPLLGAFRPLPQAVTERRQNASCRGGTDLPSTDRALTSQEGRELSGPPREREDVELDMSAVGDPSRRSTESSGDGESESAQETEEALRREIDDPDDSAEGSGRLHLEAEWEEGETGDGLIVGRAQYVALLRQVIEHLAPNVCSLRVRYTSASTCDLPLSMISFPLLQELVLDNYCPDAHLEIDKIVVPRTHTVTVGLNGYHVDPTRLYKFDRFNGEYWQHGSVDASPSQKSYLRLFRALEPVSYYFKGPEDVLFLLSLNEDVAAEIRNSPPPVSDDIWTATTTSPANNVPVCTEPVADCPGRLSLSVTVSGRDLRDSAKAILAEAERCMKEQEEREEGSEDALGGNSCSASVFVDPSALPSRDGPRPDGEGNSMQDGEDAFSALDLIQLFPVPSTSPETFAEPVSRSFEEDREHLPCGPNGSARLNDSRDYASALLWGPSSVFRSCISFGQLVRNESVAMPASRGTRNPTPGTHHTTATAGGQGTFRQRHSVSGFVQAGTATCRRSGRRNVLSWLASLVVSFFEEGMGGSCVSPFFPMSDGSEHGGILLALCLLALVFGDDASTLASEAQEAAGGPAEVQDLRCIARPGCAAQLWKEMQKECLSGFSISERRLNFVGLIIVDLDMHASTTGASAEVIAAAMRLTDERFGKRLRKSEGCGVRTSMSSTVQEGPTGLRRPLHPACNASTAAGETERAGPYSTELPSRGLHVPAVENRLNNCSIPGVSAGTTQVREALLSNSARAKAVHPSGIREPLAAPSTSEGTSPIGQAATAASREAPYEDSRVRCTDSLLSDRVEASLSDENSPCGSCKQRDRRPWCGHGDVTCSDGGSRGAQTAEAAFCCPVIGRHLERLVEALPTLVSLQIRYSRQHPLYLLDDQTLHVALAPSSRFLVTRCGFTEARDDGAPGASDAFGSSGRRLTKLGFACERVKLSELGR